MSTTRVVRYTTTDTSYGLEVGLQQTNTSRPGFSNSSGRKLWTTNANGTNTVQLNSSPNPESGQSIIGMQAQASDPFLQDHRGIPSTRCTGTFVGPTTVNISASSLNNAYDTETTYFTNQVDGLYISSSQWRLFDGSSNSVVYNGNRGLPTSTQFPTRTLKVTGSGVTLDTANQNQATTGNNLSKVNISVNFIGTSPETFVHSVSNPGVLTRTWEGDDHIIDGNGGDNDPALQGTFSISVQGAILRLGESSVSSNFSVNETSINKKFAVCNMSVGTTTATTPTFKLGATKNLQANANVLVSTNNLALATASLQGTATLSITPSFKPAVIDNFTAIASAASSAGVIYDITGDYTWDSFNLNTYFETGFSVDDFVTVEGEYTWTFLATTAWDDWPVESWLGNEASWDNWPNDLWEKQYVVESAGSMLLAPTFKLGDTVSYTGSFTVVEDTALEEPGAANLVSTFTIDPTASGVIDVTIAITSAMSPSLTANISYALDDTPIVITGAFTPVLTASAITDTFADIDVAFTFAVEPTFKPSGQATITAATELDLSPRFKPAGLAALTALASTLQVGRLFFQADPFNTIKVDAETRTIVVPVENTQTWVMAENRVNIVSAETRAHLVPQETRSLKLNIPPMTNRFSTPRVRSNH